MFKDRCFTEAWLKQFKKQKDHRHIDKIILEKMIYALYLAERLKANGLDFILKGGTSLVLLLEEGNRFSIDIDIISKTNREDLETILNRVIDSSHFIDWELDERRSYQPGVPKAHYKFFFDTNMQGSGSILLDVLIEEPIYPELIQNPIATKWIETDDEVLVTVPSIDSITGDKLTAFAPNTIGIPYFKGKDRQSFTMEICKQLFDLGKLFERIENPEMVATSYRAFAEKEIEYRKNGDQDSGITPEMALQDTIDNCVIIAKRGAGSDVEKAIFKELHKGLRAFGTGFLMSGHFRINDAVSVSARIAYMAAKILKNDLSPIAYFAEHSIHELAIEASDWIFLNKLKRQPDKSSFYYWVQTVNLLSKENS